MSGNLKNRLRRIRDTGKEPRVSDTKTFHASSIVPGDRDNEKKVSGAVWSGWEEAGFMSLKRIIYRDLMYPLPSLFPETLAILVPDLFRIGRIPAPNEFLFFDLETTGLSGGAGTLAFLAAFGRFMQPTVNNAEKSRLEITQYLLLDYPGECSFIDALVNEFTKSDRNKSLPLVVSYNGKTFDSQILKTRCLMNRVKVPEYFHADLLHPARRFWKHKLPDCSQATVETAVLGLDRIGDVSGALAPDIWFSFLRSNENRELLSICEHNASDIVGLATLLLAFSDIASDPINNIDKYNVDEESLALFWQKAVKKNSFFFKNDELGRGGSRPCPFDTGEKLLKTAAGNGWSRAAVAMAIKAEWQLKDPALALAYTKSVLMNPEINERMKNDLEKRQERLLAKMSSL